MVGAEPLLLERRQTVMVKATLSVTHWPTPALKATLALRELVGDLDGSLDKG
jgi:hypothetical protein